MSSFEHNRDDNGQHKGLQADLQPLQRRVEEDTRDHSQQIDPPADLAPLQRRVEEEVKGVAGAGAGAGAKRSLPEDLTASRAVAEYAQRRQIIVAHEAMLSFDYGCRMRATLMEQRADAVLQRLRAADQRAVFDAAGPRYGYGQQAHTRFQGDHFLSNEPLIAQTQLLRVARKLPKGAHLHIHFNACLEPHVLLQLAREQPRMFITSDRPLVFPEDQAAEEEPRKEEPRKSTGETNEQAKEGTGETKDDTKEGTGEKFEDAKAGTGEDGSWRRPPVATGANTPNFFLCEIQFSILSPEKEQLGDMFSAAYKARQTMPFREFLERFPEKRIGMSAMDWLVSKLVFGEEETYDIPQTSRGAWERFNARTRMMKGLFNYVSVYRKYTELFLQDLLDDNIQYAEIRPNFMMTNQLWHDDGSAQVDNRGIVELIIDACETFKAKLLAQPGGRHFDGIKIIYCTPRSFSRPLVRDALAECLQFKLYWPDYIAGFDLVGEEARGHPLQTFVPELLEFRRNCQAAGVAIPFLFHCGETLELGTAVDGNLVDALLLGSKRIGHGFALPRHPHVLTEMRRNSVCVEVCPISNEILGLTPRIGGHAVYSLLAQNVPCTLNSDNGTLFRSSLSHDFYQVFVGRADFSLFGWRQLAEWSLEHACLSPAELQVARRHWLAAYDDFLVWLLATYDASPESQYLVSP